MAGLRSVRTDLTLEAHELLQEQALREKKEQESIPGVRMENAGNDMIRVT